MCGELDTAARSQTIASPVFRHTEVELSMRRGVLVILLLVIAAGSSRADGAAGGDLPRGDGAERVSTADFRDRQFEDDDGLHRYVVFVPPGYSGDRTWPVVLSLHGAGERGRDGRQQLTVGLGAVVEHQPQEFPAIIVFPQVAETDERILTAWSPDHPDGRRALRALAEVEREFRIDPARRVLAGWSMGGYGVWQLAAASEPGFWSAALSVSGGAAPDVAARIPPGLPLWAIHGATDRIVEPARMQEAVAAAAAAGRTVFSTLVSGEGHGIWQVAFGRSEVRQWLLDPASINPADVDWSPDRVAEIRTATALPERPFQASAVIQRAVAIRIGNEAFQEFGRGVPAAIPQERLQGEVRDIERSIVYGGETIRASIRDIQWTAELDAADIQAIAAEQLVVRVGLKNLRLRSGGGELSGGGYSARCGPFDVVLGCWRPVWVEVFTRPRVRDGKVVLTEPEIEFTIPDDNWIVTEPEWATASGPGLTPELVKVGVVGGMYRSKDRVEAAVRELIPPLIERIERRLVQVPPESVASLLWPLPTAPPRVRLIPEGIRTDSGGVSVTVGLAVEGPAVDRAAEKRQAERAPAETGRATAAFPSRIVAAPIREGDSSGALVGIAPGVLSAVAAMFADDPNARLDLRDLPGSPLLRLSEESLLREIAPGVGEGEQDFELRTVLSLPEPFELELGAPADPEAGHLELRLHAPAVRLAVSRRPRHTTGGWQPCFEGLLAVTQGLTVDLNGSVEQGRVVRMDWSRDPAIAGVVQFAPGFAPQDPTLRGDRLVDAFREAWGEWTAEAGTTSTVDDLAVGGARLRLNALPVRGGRVWLEFEPRTERVSR